MIDPHAPDAGWQRVVFSAECDDDGTCPVCLDVDFGECPCPGPTQEEEFEYGTDVLGNLWARPL